MAKEHIKALEAARSFLLEEPLASRRPQYTAYQYWWNTPPEGQLEMRNEVRRSVIAQIDAALAVNK